VRWTRVRITANSIAFVLGRCVGVVASLVAASLVVRALGAAKYGAFSYALNFVLILQFFTDFGLTQTAVRELATGIHPEKAVLGVLLRARMALGLLAAGGLVAFAVLSGLDPQIRATVAVSAVLLCIGPLGGMAALFQARLMGAANALVQAAQPLIWLAIAAVALNHTRSPVGLMVAYVAAAAGSVLVIISVAAIAGGVRIRELSWSWTLFANIAREGLLFGLAGMFVTIYYRIDSILLFHLAGPSAVGVYSAAYRLLDQVQVVPQAVMASLFPVLAYELTRDRKRFVRLIQGGFDVLVVLGLPLAVGVLLLAAPIIRFLFGPDFAASATVLRVLAPTIVSIFVGYVAGYLVLVARAQREYLLIVGAGALLNVALNVVLIPVYGPVGAAVATLCTEFPVMASTLVLVLRRLEVRLDLRRGWRAASATLLMALGLYLVPVENVFVAAAWGGFLYMAAAAALGIMNVRDLVAWRTRGEADA